MSGPAKRVGPEGKGLIDVVAKTTELHRFENRLPKSKILVIFAPGGACEPSAHESRPDPKGTTYTEATEHAVRRSQERDSVYGG